MAHQRRYQWRNFVSFTVRKVIRRQDGQNSGRTRGCRDPLRCCYRVLVSAGLLIQESQLHVRTRVSRHDLNHVQVALHGLGTASERTVQIAQFAVGLNIVGIKGQGPAEQGFGFRRALLSQANLRHEVERPHLIRLFRQHAPELYLRIVDSVLGNEPGNRAARSRLPP